MLHGVLDARRVSGERDATERELAHLLETATIVGDVEATKVLAHHLQERSQLASPWPDFTYIGRHLGEAAAMVGEPQQAGVFYRQALDLGAKLRNRPESARTRLLLAELLLTHYPDQRAEAMEHLDFSIAEFQAMKMQPSLERALKHKGLLHA